MMNKSTILMALGVLGIVVISGGAFYAVSLGGDTSTVVTITGISVLGMVSALSFES
jgi:ADP-ribosylglycohydrolase